MGNIKWHKGFVSAMKLELIENEQDLQYFDEHYIANRNQRIDLLVIKNEKSAIIYNPIGASFSKYNICEYKSPSDSLTYGDFFKTLAYTGLYLNETHQGKLHNAGDYTMTFIREPHPNDLFARLSEYGVIIKNNSPGVYYLTNKLPFATQVIVTREIPENQCTWLKCLTKHGTRQNLCNILSKTPTLNADNKNDADVIMDIFTSANKEFVSKQMKEEPAMCKAVNELFADEIKEKDAIISNQQSQLANQQSQLAKKDALIAKLQAELEKYAGQTN